MDVKELQRSSGGSRHVWETARFRVVKDLLRLHLPEFGRKGDALLDIGCGDGFVLGELAKRFADSRFFGVDRALPSEILETLNRKYPNMRVAGSLEETSPACKAVLLLDVIEHVSDDVGFLRDIGMREELSNATYVITAPAFNRLFSNHDRFLGHYRRYTLAQLTSTVTKAGFTFQRGGYFFFLLLPARIVELFFESILSPDPGKAGGVATWKKRGIIDAAIETILYADYKALLLLSKLGLTLPGLSCFVICSRQRS